jgi:hypothetical protein
MAAWHKPPRENRDEQGDLVELLVPWLERRQREQRHGGSAKHDARSAKRAREPLNKATRYARQAELE